MALLGFRLDLASLFHDPVDKSPDPLVAIRFGQALAAEHGQPELGAPFRLQHHKEALDVA